jgi:signal transduction histidine kinase
MPMQEFHRRPPRLLWLSFGEAVCGCAAQEGKRIVCENIPDSDEHRTALVRSFGVKAYAANPIFGANGAVIGTLSFGTKKKTFFTEDELSLMKTVTAQVSVAMQRKKAEEALRKINEDLEAKVAERTEQLSKERQRLYGILETLPAYVILLDKDHRVPFANKVFREQFGESRGQRCHKYLFNRDGECPDCVTYNVYRENKPQHWYWTGPNGRDYDIYDFPLKEADGSTLILEMGIDITERKRAEAQAMESAQKLKDAERLATIGATAGMVGHDIRNPLQAITGDLYLAKSETADLPDSNHKQAILESIAETEKNVDYINKIVQDLQDYARPLNPKTEETDIKKVVEKLIEKNGIPSNIKVGIEISATARTVKADSYYLNRVLFNLVTNAIQAMPNGGKLTITAKKKASDIVIEVEDTGTGIPKEIQNKMFTVMFTTKSKGQGFGLPVVKRMTESLGGTVTFESEEGRGTTFFVRLPQR